MFLSLVQGEEEPLTISRLESRVICFPGKTPRYPTACPGLAKLGRGLYRFPHCQQPCAHLLPLDAALWTFASHLGVEPTNNAAERALRHPVIWRRLSDSTPQAIIAHRSGQPAPSLLPDPCGGVFIIP